MSRFVIRLSACLALLLSLPLAQASATSQFSLNPKKHASKCFVECHDRVVDTIPLPDGEPNNQGYIGPNCANPDYTQLITMCITQLCPSPSDAAYAAEYAVSWCGRAGVDVKIELPKTYLDQEAAYFQSTEYLSRGTQGVKNWGLGGVVLLGLPALMVLFVL